MCRCAEPQGSLAFFFKKKKAFLTMIGQFFVDLMFWALLLCLWTFSTLVGLNARANAAQGMSVSVDPQHIVVIAL